MAGDKLMSTEYLHAFTLYQDPKAGRNTGAKARKAYTDALEAKGFKSHASDGQGTLRHLPDATMVGGFASDSGAKLRARAAAPRGANVGRRAVRPPATLLAA